MKPSDVQQAPVCTRGFRHVDGNQAQTAKVMRAFPEHVVLGGGGSHALMYLGVLQEASGGTREAYLKWVASVKTFAGASMGALLACALCFKTPWEVADHFASGATQELAERIVDTNLPAAVKRGALNTGEELDRILQTALQKFAGDAHITFADMAGAGARSALTVAVTRVDTGAAVYCTAATTPDLQVWRALRASAALPVLFPPVFLPGIGFCTDGGVACNLPVHLFPPGDTFTCFVHSGGAPPHTLYFARLLENYMAAAQLGALRAQPAYCDNAVPCIPGAHCPSAYNFSFTRAVVLRYVLQGKMSFAARVVVEALVMVFSILAAPSRPTPTCPTEKTQRRFYEDKLFAR